jgi:hypothetical protein
MLRMAKRRTRDPGTDNTKRNGIIAAALGLVTVVAVAGGFAYDSARTSAATSTASETGYVPAPTVVPTPVVAVNQISDVMPRLDDKLRPFNVVVFGDSTGVARRGWVVQLGEALGQRSGRPVALNPWSVEEDPDQYIGLWRLATGTGAEVTIWNASASGTDARYSSTRMDELAPIDPNTVDLVFVNHGHNEGIGELVSNGGSLMRKSITKYPNAAVVGIVQNPERPGSAHAEDHLKNNVRWRADLARRGDPMIDVETPYMQMPGWETAFDTPTGNLHPNQAGYDLWTGVVRQNLGI